MKPTDHKRITRRAIEIFCHRQPGPFADLLSHHCEQIVDGSRDADTRPLHVRATNWHFYRANGHLKPIETHLLWVPITIYPTSDHILRLRIEELSNEVEKGISHDLFNLVGRILHHTQDMSTPAHVVPVYHGMDILDLVPDDLNVRDSFEDYAEEHSPDLLAALDIDAIHFDELAYSPPDLFANYEQAAQRTLRLLFDAPEARFPAMVDGKRRTLDWSMFWQQWREGRDDAASRHGFGRYGPLGAHFGDTDIEQGGKHYQIDSQVYRAELGLLLGKMVEDSIRALAGVRDLLADAGYA